MSRQVAVRMALPAAAAAVAIAVLALQVNREFGCAEPEDLPMPVCAAAQGDARIAELRERIRANPGDSMAWIALAFEQRGAEPAVLQAAYTLAPAHPETLLLKAGRSIEADRLQEAIDPLFRLVNLYADPQAARTLAQLLAEGQHTKEFDARLQPGQRWLPHVLGALGALKLPRSSAFKLVQDGWKRGLVTDAQVQAYINALKAEGQWLTAYSLWVALQPKGAPLLVNGSFEQPIGQGAFNWETPAGAGARLGGTLRIRDETGRGRIVEIQFNGRPIRQPLLRQPLILVPGPYVLRGRYATRLRSEHGLAWTLRCLAPPQTVVARSAPMLDSQGTWRAFETAFTVPASCGMAVQLQLETAEAYESQVGVRGSAAFDDIELARAVH